MPMIDWFSKSRIYKLYDTNEKLYVGLKNTDGAAIACLQDKAMVMTKKIIRGYGIADDQLDIIINNSILTMLNKIASQDYVYIGNNPVNYLLEIVKRNALMATRSIKRESIPIDELPDLLDSDIARFQKNEESASLLMELLTKLGEPDATIVRLHHIDGYSDSEVIELGLTKFKSIDSLKVKRSESMKKLVKIAQAWKSSNVI
jgi:hypothetical protein